MTKRYSRREWLGVTALAGGGLLTGCDPFSDRGRVYGSARVLATPKDVAMSSESGVIPVTVGTAQAQLYVPASALLQSSASLMLYFHGSYATPTPYVNALKAYADESGVLVLAPYVYGVTWDAVTSKNFGQDVYAAEGLMNWVFDRWRIHPDRVAVAGHSDGATYALGLGLANGDLFSHVLAQAPGSLLDVAPVGRPRVTVAHGQRDATFSQAATNILVERLRVAGYTVDYRSFDGGHGMRGIDAREVMRALVAA